MELRAYRALRAAGATWADIAREAGCDWRTAKKYLAGDAPVLPARFDEHEDDTIHGHEFVNIVSPSWPSAVA